jgi:hypothetical protein
MHVTRRELLLMLLAAALLGHTVGEAPSPVRAAADKDASGACRVWTTRMAPTGIGEAGWEPFAVVGNARRNLTMWRRCGEHPTAAAHRAADSAAAKGVELGTPERVAAALPILEEWVDLMVVFERKDANPVVGQLQAIRGTNAIVMVSGRPLSLDLLTFTAARVQ